MATSVARIFSRLDSVDFTGGSVSFDAQTGKLHKLIIDGKVIVDREEISQGIKSLSDRHIEVYLSEIEGECQKRRPSTENLQNIAKKITDRLAHNDVAQKVYENKIAQINDKPQINHNITKVAIVVIVLALFATVIGTGALLTNAHVLSSTVGIPNISNPIAISLVSFGAVTMLAYVIGRIVGSRNKNSKIAHLIKDINLTIRNAYLFSNLNDATASIVYLLAAIVLIIPMGHGTASWFLFAAKCFGYPTGILYLGSGIQQVYESSIELKNSFKVKNLITLIGGLVVIFMGGLFIMNLQSSIIGIGTNWIINFIPFLVIGLTLSVVMKQFKDLQDVADKPSDDKRFFLENNLALTEEEINELKDDINKWSYQQVLKWIEAQSSFSDRFMKKVFNEESDHIRYWREKREEFERLMSVKSKMNEVQLNEIKKQIIRQEIKVRMEKKIDSFAGKIERETLKEVVELLHANETDAQKIDAVFAKVKKESAQKNKAEWGKIALQVAFLGTAALASQKALYGLSQVVLNSINIAINSTSRYRNVPTAFLERYFNINKSQVGRQTQAAFA